jgi:P27 family predicted phage terminase small subunit
MPPRGRKPKSAELKKLSGNAGHKKLEPPEVVGLPSCGDLEPPKNFPKKALEEWQRVVPTLANPGLLSPNDRALLEMGCMAYAQWWQMQDEIKKEGMIQTFYNEKTGNFYSQQRPEVGIAKQCFEQYKAFAVQFGLTPLARVNLKATGPAPEGVKPDRELFPPHLYPHLYPNG